jgi:cytochrome c6
MAPMPARRRKSEGDVILKRFTITVLALTLLTATVYAADPGAGKDLFAGKCVMCHGADGAGNTAMGKRFNIQNLRAPEIQKRSDAELAASITKGKNKMPAFEGKLTPEQVSNVVAHIRELPKQK